MDGEVLAGGAALGDRFVAALGEPDGDGWMPASELFGARLAEVLPSVGTARGTDNTAVAGTLLVEQYAQRLVAPVLAALYRDGAGLDAGLPGVRALVVDGMLRRLAFAQAPAAPADVERVRAAATANLETVADAVHHHTRAGRRVLRGAIANAVASSLLHMSWPDADRARYVPAAREFLTPDLADLVTVDVVDGWMYTDRATCCLAFRTTVNQAREQPYCSACPVLPATTTRELFERATAAYEARFPRP
jgi:Ferric iron reductase FhuF-like transporter